MPTASLSVFGVSGISTAFITDMLIINKDFLDKNNIDYVIHSFNDSSDKNCFIHQTKNFENFIEASNKG